MTYPDKEEEFYFHCGVSLIERNLELNKIFHKLEIPINENKRFKT